MSGRVRLVLQGDSMSALYDATLYKAKGYGTNLVARELSLLMGEAMYRPDVVEHVPGISNKLPYHLSRRFEPGHGETPEAKSMDKLLANAVERVAPVRVPSWYLAHSPAA